VYVTTDNPMPAAWMAGMEPPPDRPEYTIAEAAESLAREAGIKLAGYTLPAGTPMIHGLIIEAMRRIGAVEKLGEYNEAGTQYKYRSVDAVVNACRPALAEVGIYPLPIVREVVREWGTTRGGAPRRDQIVRITYRFTAPDGSFVEVHLETENWSTSDKGSGAAYSALYRIALCQLFCIPTGDPDPDASYPETGTAPRLSKPLVAYLLDGIRLGTLEGLEAMWKLLTAHVPGDSRVPEEESGRVWWEVFAERYRREVEARNSKDDLAALWKALGPFGLGYLVGEGRNVADLIKERNAALVRAHQLAMEEIRDLVAEATDEPALIHATEVTKNHLTQGRINGQDSLAWLERIDQKRTEVKAAEAEAARAAMDDAPEGGQDELPTREGR
jgi:hypothetical protein